MKYLFIASLLVLSGCATSPDWNPESVAPKSIKVHFVDREEWASGDFTNAFLYDGETTLGVARREGDTCHIYFPAHRGIPTDLVMRHELRHCFEGSHTEWD